MRSIELQPRPRAAIATAVLLTFSVIRPGALAGDAAGSGPVEKRPEASAEKRAGTPAAKPVQIIRAVELHWDTIGKAKRKKLQAQLQTLVVRPCTDDIIEKLVKEMYLWDAGPNMGGKVWGESVPGGIRVVIAVRGIPASALPKRQDIR